MNPSAKPDMECGCCPGGCDECCDCCFVRQNHIFFSICLPILSRYGGTLLKVEADDLFVLFPTAAFAVQAAAACIAATKAFSATKARKNDKIILD